MITTTIDHTPPTTNNRIYGLGTVYATARSTSSATDGVPAVGQLLTAGDYYCIRTVLKFDTSVIPSVDIIAQVNLKMSSSADTSTDDFDVKIAQYNWSASDPLSVGNMETVYDGILGASIETNIWRNTSGMSEGVYYTSGNLDTAWVSRTGLTYYGIISGKDLAATAPTQAEYLTIDYTNVPQLVIVHYRPGRIYFF